MMTLIVNLEKTWRAKVSISHPNDQVFSVPRRRNDFFGLRPAYGLMNKVVNYCSESLAVIPQGLNRAIASFRPSPVCPHSLLESELSDIPFVFLTVGSESCDRLVRAFDEWAAKNAKGLRVLAQIGPGGFRPKNCESVDFLNPREYKKAFEQASLVVSHAGMGTIITAIQLKKRLVVMPRLASLGETRNEHQLATVRHFNRCPNICIADTENHLSAQIDSALFNQADQEVSSVQSAELLESKSVNSLTSFVRDFIVA